MGFVVSEEEIKERGQELFKDIMEYLHTTHPDIGVLETGFASSLLLIYSWKRFEPFSRGNDYIHRLIANMEVTYGFSLESKLKDKFAPYAVSLAQFLDNWEEGVKKITQDNEVIRMAIFFTFHNWVDMHLKDDNKKFLADVEVFMETLRERINRAYGKQNEGGR